MWTQMVPNILYLTNFGPKNVSQNSFEVEIKVWLIWQENGPGIFGGQMVQKISGLHVPELNQQQQLYTKFDLKLQSYCNVKFRKLFRINYLYTKWIKL